MRKLVALRSLSLKTFGLTVFALGALFASGACTSEEGVTPRCVQDVNAEGNQHLENGCNQFARCEIDPADPVKCCTDSGGNPLEGQLLDLCLYGYGAFDIPTENSGSGGSGGTGGTGGAGGTS